MSWGYRPNKSRKAAKRARAAWRTMYEAAIADQQQPAADQPGASQVEADQQPSAGQQQPAPADNQG